MSNDTFTVQRKTTIAAPAAAIHERISDFHRWTEWSPWEDLDPELGRTYSGPDAGIGAVYEWSGNRKAGAGRMEVTDAAAEQVTVDVQFLKPFKSQSTTVFTLEEAGDTTAVTWTMTGPMTLMSKIMGIFVKMDKMIGPDFERGLAKLKAVSE